MIPAPSVAAIQLALAKRRRFADLARSVLAHERCANGVIPAVLELPDDAARHRLLEWLLHALEYKPGPQEPSGIALRSKPGSPERAELERQIGAMAEVSGSLPSSV
jgi:hypothetical protein